MRKEMERLSSRVGDIVVLYDVRYHVYSAYLKSNPSINIKTRHKSVISEMMERIVEQEEIVA